LSARAIKSSQKFIELEVKSHVFELHYRLQQISSTQLSQINSVS